MNASEVLAAISASDKPHYVYVLRYPSGAPFYVGVGTGRRILDHVIFAKRPRGDSHKLRVIRKILRSGAEIFYDIDGHFDDRQQAAAREAELIAKIGRRDQRTGPLTNVTDGGEGAPSISEAARLKRSESLKIAWSKRDKVKAMAHLHTPEVKAKEIAAKMGRKRGPYNWTKKPGPKAEARARLSAAMKANPLSRRPGVADKIAAGNRGKTWVVDSVTKRRTRAEMLER